jgi:hypothetical protein
MSSSYIILTFLFLLTINSIYAQNYTSSNSNNNFKNLGIKNTTTIPLIIASYKYEPFLSLDGSTFRDIPQEEGLTLNNFAIVVGVNTNQTNLEEPAQLVNKGGFNSEKEGENMNYGIWFSKNGNIQGGFETQSGENYEVNSSRKYNDGKWHYVLLSYDDSMLKLDIDGKQISTKNTNGAIPDSTGKEPLRIGANSLEKGNYFTGKIDEVRIWNRGLTNSEISQIYANNTFDSRGQIVYLDFKEKENGNSANNNSNKISNNSNVSSSNKNITIPLHSNETLDNRNKNNNFNIAVAADWGCDENATKTVKNILNKDPELVLGVGDYSYKKSADCWFKIIEPLKSKMKIAIGDHEYSDTIGGAIGVNNQYLKPLNLEKTYYSFDKNNVHVTVIDPYIDYGSSSTQYQFIENDLKTASNNPNIDWMFVAETIPIYTSPFKHPANSTIRDTFHPLFDKYDVDLVFTSDNHNYQRTFPLKYNSNGNSSNPIITDRNQSKYYGDHLGQIYIISGTAGRSLYPIKEQAPFVAKQDYEHYGCLNIEINGKTLKGTFFANESEFPRYHYVKYQNNIIDKFTILKTNESSNEIENL